MSALIFWVGLALAFFWTVGAYNRLIKLRAVALQKAQALATHLLQYVEWVKLQLPEYNSASVFAGHERDLEAERAWQGVNKSLQEASRILAQFQTRPLDEKAQIQMVLSIKGVDQFWAHLLGQEPDLAGSTVPEHQRAQWQALLIHRSGATSEYNQAVQAYHRALLHTPEVWLARAARLQSLPEIHLAA
jgi:LemA protein